MAEFSKIEWCDHTFNGWEGCQHASTGCLHCYAEKQMKWFGRVQWGPHAVRRRTSAANWQKPFGWNRKAFEEEKPAKVFCSSMADVFDNHWSVDPAWRSDLFTMIRGTEWLDWLLLTKRPQNIEKMLPDDYGPVYGNVWLGTTCENQEEADRRIPHLTKHFSTAHFISVEPMLGPVTPDLSGIQWVICGGESGAKDKRRPFDCDWARTLRDQCAAAGVPFFMKQVDKVLPIPDDLMIRQFPVLERPAVTAAAHSGPALIEIAA